VNCTALIHSGQLSDEILARVHFIRGGSYSALCDDRRAIEDFDEAVRLDPPDVAYAYYSRAYTYADLNEYDRAVSDWETAIQLWGKEYSVVLRLKGVQEELKKDGYYAGPIDGIIGPGTRRGLISRFKARPERDCAVNQN
jgi:tetratricopeptide (TPR) repeat protein